MYDVALSRIKTFINCLVALGVVGLGELGYSAEAIDELIKSGAAIDMDPALRD